MFSKGTPMTRRHTALLLAITLLVGFAASCASLAPEPKWEGRKIDEAVAEYGPPTRVSPSDTGKSYVWETRTEMRGMGAFPGATRETRVTIRMMTVNADGIITSYNRVDQ
jgi:hypothetical protein